MEQMLGILGGKPILDEFCDANSDAKPRPQPIPDSMKGKVERACCLGGSWIIDELNHVE